MKWDRTTPASWKLIFYKWPQGVGFTIKAHHCEQTIKFAQIFSHFITLLLRIEDKVTAWSIFLHGSDFKDFWVALHRNVLWDLLPHWPIQFVLRIFKQIYQLCWSSMFSVAELKKQASIFSKLIAFKNIQRLKNLCCLHILNIEITSKRGPVHGAQYKEESEINDCKKLGSVQYKCTLGKTGIYEISDELCPNENA